VIPDLRQLREARERFGSLLAQPNAKEAVWQRFFAECPYVLSAGLPVKLMPDDVIPLGRPPDVQNQTSSSTRATRRRNTHPMELSS